MKRFLLPLILAALSPSALAVLDDNSNEISDVWEWYYSYPPSNDPTAGDMDGDGDDDFAEAAFGRNPHDPTSKSPQVTLTDTDPDFEFTFPSTVGIQYQVQGSPTLLPPWTNAGGPLIGTGSIVAGGVTGPFGGYDFLRLQAYFPRADADGDGLDTYEEWLFGSNDGFTNSDADTLTDIQEFYLNKVGIRLDPTKEFTVTGIRDGDGDADGDGVSDKDELLGGTGANDITSYPASHASLDLDGDKLPDAWEVANFGDLSAGPFDDPDVDQILNLDEIKLNTNPNLYMTDGIRRDGLADQDHDNVIDVWELEDKTNPLVGGGNVDLATNFVVLNGKMEHKGTWGPVSDSVQFNGTIMRATAIGYDNAEMSSSNRIYGVVNEVSGLVQSSGSNYATAPRFMRFRKGVTYSVAIVTTGNNLPFVSGKYFWTTTGNGDDLNERYFSYDVGDPTVPAQYRQSYTANASGTPVPTDLTLSPNPDVQDTHFTQKSPSQGSPDATLYPTGTLNLGRNMVVDRNMNSVVGSSDLKDLNFPDKPRGLIVDVNNTLVSGSLLNGDTTLTDAEKNNASPLYGNARRVEPLLLYFGYGGLPAGSTANLKLESGGENLIRIFDSSTTPIAVLGGGSSNPGTTTYALTAAQKTTSASQRFWIEGLAAGEAVIVLELTPPGGSTPTHIEKLRVEVNVDREPTASGAAPNFGARHRARAIKAEGAVRAIAGRITSRKPLLTWTPQKVRSGMTGSLWLGFEPSSGPYSGKAWAQAGLQIKMEDGLEVTGNPTTDKSTSFTYCEIAADYPKYSATLAARFFKRITHPSAPTPGQHKWQNLAVSIEYISTGGSEYSDSIEIVMMPADNNFAPLSVVSLTGNEASGFDEVNLASIGYNEIQAGWESTASITRVPGLPNAHAIISDIRIKNGPRETIGAWHPANFSNSHLQIKLVNPDDVAASETLHADVDTLTGATSYLHYNIKLENPYTVHLWDKYRWNQAEGKDW